MKLIFKKEALFSALNIVSKAITGRTTNPILECILFDASTSIIKLCANDEEIAIETTVDGEIKEKGKIALNAKLIYDIIRKLDAEGRDIIIETNNLLTTISCDKAIFNIQGMDGEEFNYLPYIEKNAYISISQFTLRESIRQTIFSVDNNDSNKMMSGELLEVEGNKLKFVSLDGHRISIRNIIMKDIYENAKVVVPSKTLNELSKIISSDNEKEVFIYFSKNHILFEFDNTSVVSRLIDGEYFKIDHMLLADYETKFVINRNKLLSSIDQAMTLIRENDHKPIILDIKGNILKLKVESSIGSMDIDLDCEISGKDLMIAFNPKFLIDALKVIEDENVNLYMTNAKSPCFIRDNEEKYIYLILPVNFIA